MLAWTQIPGVMQKKPKWRHNIPLQKVISAMWLFWVFLEQYKCAYLQRKTKVLHIWWLTNDWGVHTHTHAHARTHTHTHTHLMALCLGLHGWAGTRKVKPIWIILEQDSEWQLHQLGHMQVCTSLQRDNHASIPQSVFYRPGALPAAQPTVSKHWRHDDWDTM